MFKKRKLALKKALEMLGDFDGLTLNKFKDLASKSKQMMVILKLILIIVNKLQKKKIKISLPIYIKDSYIWKVNPMRSGRTLLCNIVSEKPGAKNDESLAHSPQRAFDLFINDRLITIINIIKHFVDKSKDQTDEVSLEE